MASIEKRLQSDYASHPGKFLAEELEARGMTQRALAETIGRPAQAISDIVKGKRAITPEIALQLEEALDVPAYLWVNLQGTYELIRARNAAAAKRATS